MSGIEWPVVIPGVAALVWLILERMAPKTNNKVDDQIVEAVKVVADFMDVDTDEVTRATILKLNETSKSKTRKYFK